jgi:hypothetical protein
MFVELLVDPVRNVLQVRVDLGLFLAGVRHCRTLPCLECSPSKHRPIAKLVTLAGMSHRKPAMRVARTSSHGVGVSPKVRCAPVESSRKGFFHLVHHLWELPHHRVDGPSCE